MRGPIVVRWGNPAKEERVSPTALYQCIFANWSPTLGDPTVMGWVTVVFYVASVVLAVLVYVRQSGRSRKFWLGLSVMLFFLAINKQLDLQSAFTAAGRCMAQAQGWYENRQIVQVAFILGIILLCLGITVVTVWFLRKDVANIWLALAGLGFLLAFVAIRAAGMHNFDRFIGLSFGSIRMNWILEIGGISAIIINAMFEFRRPADGRGRTGRHRQRLGQ